MTKIFLDLVSFSPAVDNLSDVDTGFERIKEKVKRVDDKTLSLFYKNFYKRKKGKQLFSCIFCHSPYLTNCVLNNLYFFRDIVEKGPDRVLEILKNDIALKSREFDDQKALMKFLRNIKSQASLLIAVAEITNYWSIYRVMNELSNIADLIVKSSLNYLFQDSAIRGEIKLKNLEEPLVGTGLILLAMGKLGAKELNYSSDIDLVAFYEPDRLEYRGKKTLHDFFNKIIKSLILILQEYTSEGYVYRTDFRLRPDPGAYPLAVSMQAAEMYYISQGQNWERSAFLKARILAGDINSSKKFTNILEPFVWRKSLDFYALRDIQSIKRQINRQQAGTKINILGHNIKLGKGGIREIELFVQIQQLIFGGRRKSLRSRETLLGLRSLMNEKIIDEEAFNKLVSAYEFYRQIENRLQMINDEQTHVLPKSKKKLQSFSLFLGYENAEEFSEQLLENLQYVASRFDNLFVGEKTLSLGGNLVFTGGDPDPDTLVTIEKLGFKESASIWETVSSWHHGRYPVTRSAKARELLTEITPSIFSSFRDTAFPDQAFFRFDEFLSKLPYGVQLFSLLRSNPKLLQLLADILGQAPRLGNYLSKTPELFQSVLNQEFFAPVPDLLEMDRSLSLLLQGVENFEDDLNIIRSWKNDLTLQVGIQMIQEKLSGSVAGLKLAEIAENAIVNCHKVVLQEFKKNHRDQENSDFAIVAMGNLGSKEMTVNSDVDLIFLYEDQINHSGNETSKNLSEVQTYYLKLVPRLLTSISVQTKEGKLYDVDTRLRPSGESGPVASSINAFKKYQHESAWVWEHMALTRARVILGSDRISQKFHDIKNEVINKGRKKDEVIKEFQRIRKKILDEKKAKNIWDIKLSEGGSRDIEFLVQYLKLLHANQMQGILDLNTAQSILKFGEFGILNKLDTTKLHDAAVLMQNLRGQLALSIEGDFEEKTAAPGLLSRLVKIGEVDNIKELKSKLKSAVSNVQKYYNNLDNA